MEYSMERAIYFFDFFWLDPFEKYYSFSQSFKNLLSHKMLKSRFHELSIEIYDDNFKKNVQWNTLFEASFSFLTVNF